MHTTPRGERTDHVTKAVGSSSVGWFARAALLALAGAAATGACRAPGGPGEAVSQAEAATEAPAPEAGRALLGSGEARANEAGKASAEPAEEEPWPCKEGDRECEVQWRLGRVPYDPTRPPGHNGLGIYITASNNSNYCFADDSNPSVFCPERFVSSGGHVYLESRAAEMPDVTYSTPVSLTRVSSSGAETPVELLAVRAKGTKLEVQYRYHGIVSTVSGDKLASFRFEFPAPDGQPYGYQWKFTPAPVSVPAGSNPPPAWLNRYESSYRLVFGGSFFSDWQRHCVANDFARQASFLGGMKVGGLYADLEVDDASVTMSCETGAIDTCLAWGYAPWGLPKPGENVEKARLVYASCLQAKRAAYFAGPEGGEYRMTSFTVPNTPILVRDTFRVMSDEPALDYLEAVWGPEGALCLNPENARVPEFRPLLSVAPSLPACPGDWRELGYLATGRPSAPPP